MGAHDYVVVIEHEDRAAVEKAWQARVDEDAYESGRGGYAGNATTMRGGIAFHDKQFSCENEAREFILDKHEKWEGPIAASFYLPDKPTERDETRKAKATERFETIAAKQFACAVAIHKAFVGRKSEFVGCKGCGSKLSHNHLVRNLRGGSESSFSGTYNGVRRTRIFTLPVLPLCPVCNASLLSETDRERLNGHDEKVKAAEVELYAALKPKAGKRLAWAVGGWAAS